VVECTGLENRRTLIAFPGFESLVSRQDSNKSPAKAGLLCFWGLGNMRQFSIGTPKPRLFEGLGAMPAQLAPQ
jgi:hypothetical protein